MDEVKPPVPTLILSRVLLSVALYCLAVDSLVRTFKERIAHPVLLRTCAILDTR